MRFYVIFWARGGTRFSYLSVPTKHTQCETSCVDLNIIFILRPLIVQAISTLFPYLFVCVVCSFRLFIAWVDDLFLRLWIAIYASRPSLKQLCPQCMAVLTNRLVDHNITRSLLFLVHTQSLSTQPVLLIKYSFFFINFLQFFLFLFSLFFSNSRSFTCIHFCLKMFMISYLVYK